MYSAPPPPIPEDDFWLGTHPSAICVHEGGMSLPWEEERPNHMNTEEKILHSFSSQSDNYQKR